MTEIRPRVLIVAAFAAALIDCAANAAPVGFEVLSTAVSSSTSCNFGAIKQSGPAGCAVVSPKGGVAYADAAVVGGWEYGDFGGFFENGFFAAVWADADVRSRSAPRNGSATAQIAAAFTLHTDGPVRQGYADLYALGGPFRCAWPDCSASISVGARTYTELGGYRGRPPFYTIPVTLGTDMTIVLQAFARDRDPGADRVSASIAGIDITFRDDAPGGVQMSQAPEPGAMGLLLAGTGFLVALSRRARSR